MVRARLATTCHQYSLSKPDDDIALVGVHGGFDVDGASLKKPRRRFVELTQLGRVFVGIPNRGESSCRDRYDPSIIKEVQEIDGNGMIVHSGKC